jgi:hypothetical protein
VGGSGSMRQTGAEAVGGSGNTRQTGAEAVGSTRRQFNIAILSRRLEGGSPTDITCQGVGNCTGIEK